MKVTAYCKSAIIVVSFLTILGNVPKNAQAIEPGESEPLVLGLIKTERESSELSFTVHVPLGLLARRANDAIPSETSWGLKGASVGRNGLREEVENKDINDATGKKVNETRYNFFGRYAWSNRGGTFGPPGLQYYVYRHPISPPTFDPNSGSNSRRACLAEPMADPRPSTRATWLHSYDKIVDPAKASRLANVTTNRLSGCAGGRRPSTRVPPAEQATPHDRRCLLARGATPKSA